EEMFQQEEQEESSDKPSGLDKEKIDQVLTGEENNNDEAKEEETQQKHDNEDESLEHGYIKKHGEKEIEQAKEQAKTVLALYLLQVTEWDKWEETVTENYLKGVQQEMSHSTQENVKRELDEVELLASQHQLNNKITYAALYSWHVTVKGKSTSKQMQLYYMTLEKEGDEWVASDMVTPDHQYMEGERKEE